MVDAKRAMPTVCAVSQTHASEQIEDVGMQVVGWYHSHPTFAPNPSVRDIETQQKFQVSDMKLG